MRIEGSNQVVDQRFTLRTVVRWRWGWGRGRATAQCRMNSIWIWFDYAVWTDAGVGFFGERQPPSTRKTGREHGWALTEKSASVKSAARAFRAGDVVSFRVRLGGGFERGWDIRNGFLFFHRSISSFNCDPWGPCYFGDNSSTRRNFAKRQSWFPVTTPLRMATQRLASSSTPINTSYSLPVNSNGGVPREQ